MKQIFTLYFVVCAFILCTSIVWAISFILSCEWYDMLAPMLLFFICVCTGRKEAVRDMLDNQSSKKTLTIYVEGFKRVLLCTFITLAITVIPTLIVTGLSYLIVTGLGIEDVMLLGQSMQYVIGIVIIVAFLFFVLIWKG